jgi:hypothetical protein
MKIDTIEKGDCVLIKSAVSNTIIHEGGVGLVLELTFGIPHAPGYSEPRKTCTLLWRGIIERNVDLEWLKKVSLPESVLAKGEIGEKETY